MGISGRIAEYFLRNSLTPLIALIALLLGIGATLVTPREEEPQINVTMANVFVPFPGAAARDVEALVAGNDVALISGAQNVDEVYLALVAAVTDGTITEKRLAQSVKRVLDFKGVKGPCPAGGAAPKADPADPASTTAPGTDAPVLERDLVGGGQPADQG